MKPHDLPDYPAPLEYENAIRECFYHLEDLREREMNNLPEIANTCISLIATIYGRSVTQVQEDLADCEMILGL